MFKCICEKKPIKKTGGSKQMIIRGSPKQQLLPDGMIDGLGDRVMALARKHEEPGGSPNRNLREAYYDVWRLIAMAVRDECNDAVIRCPDCDRLWLYVDGQEEGIAYRPETT